MPKPLQSGQDGPSATPTGCEKRRAPAAAGGWPRSRAHFLFASFLCASKEKGLARQGETLLPDNPERGIPLELQPPHRRQLRRPLQHCIHIRPHRFERLLLPLRFPRFNR